eukprot:GHVU01122579.1.p1 GENE.GHVU01122579.1~~GHVU01122579.1.p1  ORF type:complete len:103 (+),score=0.03 GHVU01122579.1:100-408(+)
MVLGSDPDRVRPGDPTLMLSQSVPRGSVGFLLMPICSCLPLSIRALSPSFIHSCTPLLTLRCAPGPLFPSMASLSGGHPGRARRGQAPVYQALFEIARPKMM